MLVFALAVATALLQTPKPAALPVQEVTVFKDGHALVVAEGALPVVDGAATLDELPRPVMGTFWPYAAQAGVKLVATTAGYKPTVGERTLGTLRELISANPGKEVLVREVDGEPYPATILSATGESPTQPGVAGGFVPNVASLILLRLSNGSTKALDLSRVRDLTFKNGPTVKVAVESQAPRLTLSLSGAGGTAKVGVMYLQKGLRWIPGYKIDVDGKGGAHVRLQATLVNELIDLNGVTANLVVGVPSFAFKDQTDPIAIQQTVAALSPFFQADSRMSNAIMSQGVGGFRGPGEAPPDPEVSAAERNEDLFVFTVKNLRLKRGERMVLPIAEYDVTYKDVYTLDLLPTGNRNLSGGYEAPGGSAELARRLAQPRVVHQLRLTNTSSFPFTTAPALLMKQGKILAQSSTAYAARGAQFDIAITDATEIPVKRGDKETKRTENALIVNGTRYARVDMEGEIELRNFQPGAVEVETVRYVLGKVDELKTPGEITVLDPLADDVMPEWWSSYGNLWDRVRFTGLGRIAWKTTLPPGGQSVRLGYVWHYFTP